MAEKKKVAPGQHRATYSADRVNGGYLVRVVGPYANRFVGKEVPVMRKGEKESSLEMLDRLIWHGTDDGKYNKEDTGKPVALYSFIPHGNKDDEIEF